MLQCQSQVRADEKLDPRGKPVSNLPWYQCLFYSTLAMIIADNEQIMGWEISLFEVSEGRLY